MNKELRNAIVLFCRVVLGIMFIYASIDKIIHPGEFAKNIGYYKVLPFGLENTSGDYSSVDRIDYWSMFYSRSIC